MTKKQPEQLSFLLRLYRAGGEPETQPISGRAVWRISLENVRTRQRQGFANLEDLFDFLRALTDLSANDCHEWRRQ
jgi:hypothetical protein